MLIQEGMQPFLISGGNLEGTFVAGDDQDFAHAVEQDLAPPAIRQVALDLQTQLHADLVGYIERQVIG